MSSAQVLKLKSSSSESQDRFVLRLPKDCYEQLAVISRRNRRSMNAEITLLLENFVAADDLNESAGRIGLSPDDVQLDAAAMAIVEKFQTLSVEKQKALLALLG